jgi:hypothetical protein
MIKYVKFNFLIIGGTTMKEFKPVRFGDRFGNSIVKKGISDEHESSTKFTYPLAYYSSEDSAPPSRLEMSPTLYPAAKPTGDTQNFSMASVISTSDAELKDLANKLQKANHAKIGIREDIAMLREIVTKNEYPTEVTWRDWSFDFVAFEITQTVNSPEELINIIDNLEAKLHAIADAANALMLEMQKKQTQSQAAFQIISNIMKNQHDTLKAIISNMR